MPTPLFLPGEALSAPKLQQLGQEYTYVPTLATAQNGIVDLGGNAKDYALIWTNGNKVDVWFEFVFGSSPTLAAGVFEINLPFTVSDDMPASACGTVRLVDVSAGIERTATCVAIPAEEVVRFRQADGVEVQDDSPWTWAEGDRMVGHFTYFTGDLTPTTVIGGGGTGTAAVLFRTITSPTPKTPAVTPTPASIEAPSGGTIYAGGTGTTRTVTNESQWTAAKAASAAGDIIKITAPISVPLVYRSDKYGISGGSDPDGTEGNPIVIICEGAGEINVADTSNTVGALSVYNCDHVWCVGVKTRGSQFSVVYRNVEGTSSNPFRVAHCDLANSGHASLVIAGFFRAIDQGGESAPNGYGASAAAGEWGFSQHFIVEANQIDNPGVISDSFGECLYLGNGSGGGGWVSYAANGIVRHNRLTNCKSDWIDLKPGCAFIDILDNDMEGGYFVSGAGMQLLYVFSGIDDRPAWYDFDPQIRVEGNRCRDGNLTTTNGSSSNYMAQASLCGITFANNLGWGFANGGTGFRLRSEKAASQSQSSDNEVWTVVNNTLWMDNGVANVGSNEPSLTPFSGGLIDARNNLGPTGGSGFTDTADASDFVAPSAIPTVDTVDADAESETYGPGSAFDLDPDSSLASTGSSISDITLALDEDISQRAIPSSSPNPGAFQLAGV